MASPIDKINQAITTKETTGRASKSEDAAFNAEYERTMNERREFLTSIGAIPLPSALYALWLYTYLQQPGSNVRHVSDTPYPTTDLLPGESKTVSAFTAFGSEGATIGETNRHYLDENVIWLATKDSPKPIPTAYGATSLTLMHIPNLTQLDTIPTIEDRRAGWEYGHSTLLTLELDASKPNRLIATTNQPDAVVTYPEINDMIAGLDDSFDPEAMIESIRKSIAKRNISLTALRDQQEAAERETDPPELTT